MACLSCTTGTRCAVQPATTGRRVACSARAASVEKAAPEQPVVARRGLLGAIGLLAAAAPAHAVASRWDGVSSAIGSCELGEAGDACRQAILDRDVSKLGSYDATVSGAQAQSVAGNVPVANMGSSSKYAADTLALSDKVLAFAALNSDPVNPERLQLIKDLKADFPAWVSKYARGGSARTQSARKMYVVIDAVSAWFAANGVAPLPRPKMDKLVGDVQVALAALAAGK